MGGGRRGQTATRETENAHFWPEKRQEYGMAKRSEKKGGKRVYKSETGTPVKRLGPREEGMIGSKQGKEGNG